MNKNNPKRLITRRNIVIGGSATVASVAAINVLQKPERANAEQSNQSEENQQLASNDLTKDVAIVTGAGRGIGRACAVALARAGADVVVVDIAKNIPGHPVALATPQDLAETVRLVLAVGRRCLSIQADVRDMKQMREVVARTIKELGKVDIMIANAGISDASPLVEATDAQWRNVIDVNLIGAANTIRAVLPHMVERKQGRIVAVTSTFGRQGNAGNANYVASKWGLIGLVKSAALEAAPNNITVNAVAPTGVRTGLGGSQTAEQRKIGEQKLREYNALPIGMLEPSDVADSVVFLVSPQAKYLTGITLDVAAGANAKYTA